MPNNLGISLGRSLGARYIKTRREAPIIVERRNSRAHSRGIGKIDNTVSGLEKREKSGSLLLLQ